MEISKIECVSVEFRATTTRFLTFFAMPALDLKGCAEDSPIFRRRIAAHEESISNFDSSLKSLAKLVKSQVDLSTGTDLAFLLGASAPTATSSDVPL
jgi:hypothetical protein